MVSSGCPAKTKQTPPKPPAKKFFPGLIACCLDMVLFKKRQLTRKEKRKMLRCYDRCHNPIIQPFPNKRVSPFYFDIRPQTIGK